MSMNKGQNNSLNKMKQKKVLATGNGTGRIASQATNVVCSLQTKSSMCCCSSATPDKTNTSTSDRKIYNSFENSQENMLDINIKPGISKVELNDGAECAISREEIISRRKLKVAARKQMNKLEKQRKMTCVFVEQVEKPGFSLQLASEDFPSLDTLKTKKRISTPKQETLSTAVENVSSVISEIKSCKPVEKSWKPKVKDPIHIDLSQALQNKTDKHKLVLKKVDQPVHHSILAGNILDSDNPRRKKGKVRPDKVQKPSKLKSHILHERNERKKKLLETKENNCSVFNECLLSETADNDTAKSSDVIGDIEKSSLFTVSDVIKNEERTVSEDKQVENNQEVNCTIFYKIHSRRFREYCTNCVTEELVESVCGLLEKVAFFQDRMYAREPIKASAKRRYVAGINQVSKYLHVKKVKLLIIAPDLEKNPGEGGLDEKVQSFKTEAASQGIPCIFGPNRKRLGKAVKKKNTLVSCVAVLSYEGAEEQCAKVLHALEDAKTKYLKLTGAYEDDTKNNNQDNIILKTEESYAPADEVTSSLLATLREELPAPDRLMNAIHHTDE